MIIAEPYMEILCDGPRFFLWDCISKQEIPGGIEFWHEKIYNMPSPLEKTQQFIDYLGGRKIQINHLQGKIND